MALEGYIPADCRLSYDGDDAIVLKQVELHSFAAAPGIDHSEGAVRKMLLTQRALPAVPPPVWSALDPAVLYNGSDKRDFLLGAHSYLNQKNLSALPTPFPSARRPPSEVPQKPPGNSAAPMSTPSSKVRFMHHGSRLGGAPPPNTALPMASVSSFRRTPSVASSSSVLPPPLAAQCGPLAPQDLPLNLDAVKRHFMAEGRLRTEDAIALIRATTDLFQAEPNVLMLHEPVIVVGDLHGQFYDLLKILELGGDPSSTQYLFLGDYVDRGSFSCETLLYLYALKLCYPTNIRLLRGNHECRHLTATFNYRAECHYKYDAGFYEACMASFDCLPLAALVSQCFFCVHGGLSPDVMYIHDIDCIHRFREVPTSGAMCDLLWSDPYWDVEPPATDRGRGDKSASGQPQPPQHPLTYNFAATSFFETEPTFYPNESRSCSYVYNFASVYHFMLANRLLCIVRAHESQDDGIKLYRPHPSTCFPAIMSVFSAPNYCDTYDNKGAFLVLNRSNIAVKQFFASPHPFVMPNFMNAFAWSMPFLVDSVRAVLQCWMQPYSPQQTPLSAETLRDMRDRENAEIILQLGTILHAAKQKATAATAAAAAAAATSAVATSAATAAAASSVSPAPTTGPTVHATVVSPHPQLRPPTSEIVQSRPKEAKPLQQQQQQQQ